VRYIRTQLKIKIGGLGRLIPIHFLRKDLSTIFFDPPLLGTAEAGPVGSLNKTREEEEAEDKPAEGVNKRAALVRQLDPHVPQLYLVDIDSGVIQKK